MLNSKQNNSKIIMNAFKKEHIAQIILVKDFIRLFLGSFLCSTSCCIFFPPIDLITYDLFILYHISTKKSKLF